jgi:superfamily II DNA or RNA helicase
MPPHPFAALQFRYPYRRYQGMILDMVDGHSGSDGKYHIVAPPGSGKTIIGLELIRRFGQPAVVFAPTTTIQKQWQEKVGMFTADAEWIRQHTSLDPQRLGAINLLTYQVLSTPGENLAFVERIAADRWIEDLLTSGKAHSEAEARRRMAVLQESNPKAYRREISKRYRRVKREFLRKGDLDGREFLHPNARDLIDRIVALGTGTLILDECHHLLDYWAFILRELVRSLPSVHIVGLTATLPDPANRTEYENYTSLLGDVDFEVPTPATVKEGNLAPYRDLVYFCRPSPREVNYLQEIQRHFREAVWQVTNTTPFQDWLWQTLFPGQEPSETPPIILSKFEAVFRREPSLCIAAVKYLLKAKVPLPLQVPVIEEMLEPLSVDDWLLLMETYALRALKVSAVPEHQALYRDLRDALLPFGITISERGARRHRSPGDLVLALSESKDQAAVEILRAEAQDMGGRLRAVILTDFERMSARTRRLTGILDPDAGSAVRVFRHLVADTTTGLLAPVLVTGKVVLVSAQSRSLIEAGIRHWKARHRAAFTWEWRKTNSAQVLRLVGSGRDWSSRTYVALLTDLFERGLTRCLVGTRGIFGEGWDTLGLNTLIDLTSVTTSTSVQQIRGRTIRLDPNWQRKVAHNWDIICVSPEFDKGDADLRRFVARHAHTWGIIAGSEPGGSASNQPLAKSSAPEPQPGSHRAESLTMEGRIVRGVPHVDLQLAIELKTNDFGQLDYEACSRSMLQAAADRDQVFDLWGVGQPYENLVYSATWVQASDLAFRTTYTARRSLRSIVWRLVVTGLVLSGFLWLNGLQGIGPSRLSSASWLQLALMGLTGSIAAIIVAASGHRIWRIVHSTFVQIPATCILQDMGRALLAALVQAGLLRAELSAESVRAIWTAKDGCEVFLDGASPEDSATFAGALQQMLGPLGDARYLIERDSTHLRSLIYRPLWWLARSMFRLEEAKAFHRVPDVLASRREQVEILAHYWQWYVGGGTLVYTRTDEGRRALLQARAQQHTQIHQMALEIWR